MYGEAISKAHRGVGVVHYCLAQCCIALNYIASNNSAKWNKEDGVVSILMR